MYAEETLNIFFFFFFCAIVNSEFTGGLKTCITVSFRSVTLKFCYLSPQTWPQFYNFDIWDPKLYMVVIQMNSDPI